MLDCLLKERPKASGGESVEQEGKAWEEEETKEGWGERKEKTQKTTIGAGTASCRAEQL